MPRGATERLYDRLRVRRAERKRVAAIRRLTPPDPRGAAVKHTGPAPRARRTRRARTNARPERPGAGATGTLRSLLFNPRGEETYSDPRPWLALARCLATTSDSAGATRAAEGAAARAVSDEEARYASWLAGVASGWTDPASLDELAEGDDIWATMAKEQKAATAFQAKLEARGYPKDGQ